MGKGIKAELARVSPAAKEAYKPSTSLTGKAGEAGAVPVAYLNNRSQSIGRLIAYMGSVLHLHRVRDRGP
jgi:hypothetical protein